MKKKYLLVTIASVIILAGGGATAKAFQMNNTTKPYENVIFPGVAVEDIDLSGKTKDEAVKIIQEKYGKEVLKKKITIKAGDKTYSVDYSKLSAKYNIEDVVNEAFSYGKNHGMLEKYKLIKSPVSKPYELEFSADSKPIKELVATIQKEVDKDPVNASLSAVGRGKFSVASDKPGAKLNVEKLEKDITDKINGELSGDVEVKADIESVQASVTADTLSKVNTRLSTFTTTFATSTANRVTNISLATRSINGMLLMPGEEFSFNGVVGQRTVARGYKEAGVIINNQLDSGIGGGICQVSTALYNAVTRANINATERQHHSLKSSYAAPGLDATVDYGNIDYKFKNTLEYPVFIEGYLTGKSLTFNIYSDKSLANRTYDLVSEVYATLEPKVTYIDDPNMYEGVTEYVKKPSTGYKVRVYRKIYENGKLVDKEKLYEETYKKIDGVAKRGTKKKPVTPVEKPSSPETTTPVTQAQTEQATQAE